MEPNPVTVECASKRRKSLSDAENIAMELYKLTSRRARLSSLRKVRFEETKIIFEDSSIGHTLQGEVCCWKNQGSPIYCAEAVFRFETCLPDREYLTRYSVTCNRCHPRNSRAYYLYCSYCDEILKGSIAGPGGKIANHIVTIRHIVKEAAVQSQYFERNCRLSSEEYHQGVAYVAKLEQWASAIRFQRKIDEKGELEQVLRSLQHHLQKATARVASSQIVAFFRNRC